MANLRFNALRVTFYTQIGLLIILAVLFIIGNCDQCIPIGSFFFAITLGAIGASISLMRRLRTNDLPFQSEDHSLGVLSILIPILYGTVLAGVAYLLFMSEILTGNGGSGLLSTNLFPNFETSDPENKSLFEQFIIMSPASLQDYGKLLVWGFIAGYSERFVLGILGRIEGSVKSKSK